MPTATVPVRVLGTVVLPLLLLGAVTAQLAFARRDDAGRARAIARTVAPLNRLVELRAALFAERLQIEAPARSSSLGLGVDLPASPAPSDQPNRPVLRASTDGTLAALAPAARPFDRSALVRLRLSIDAGTLTTPVVSGRFDALDTAITESLAARLSDLGRAAVAVGEPDLAGAEAMLADTVDAFSNSAAVVNLLVDYWSSAPFEVRLAQSALARADGHFATVAGHLTTAPLARIAAEWARLTRAARGFDGAVTDALRGVASPVSTRSLGVDRLGEILQEGVHRTVAIGDLALVASEFLERTASSVNDRARADAARSTLLAAASVVISLLTAGWFGRSIVRPVRRLTDHARLVGAGDLRVDPLPLSGPPEFVMASRAVNDLVANLLLLERKADAIAACGFDDAVLDIPLPGPLGKSLHRSAEVLSGFAHQATHDALTGVANRAGAVDALTQAAARASRSGRALGVVFIDLDGFKRINDTYGHTAGDELLRVVAGRMTQTVRSGDTVARLGGDEFVVITENADSADGVATLARRVLQAVAEPVTVAANDLSVGASAGIALSGDGAHSPAELLRRADVAVYTAKRRRGTMSIEVYDEELDRQLQERAAIQDALSTAVLEGGDQLHLCYQPIVEAQTGRLSAIEALVRWERPEHGPVQPDVFIPIAETSNLIIGLDRWVLGTATRQLAAWAAEPALAGVDLSVNVSGRHLLHPSFLDNVTDAMTASGIAPERLVLEVTETFLVEDLARAAAQIEAVRNLGIRIALDDFGTGFTGLAHLRALAVDEIKIDRSYVQELPGREGRGLIQMISDLADHLHVRTVAEGVETPAQAEILNAVGCHALQGYLFAKPMKTSALVDWAEARATSSKAPLVMQVAG